jgi:hypothetical protein
VEENTQGIIARAVHALRSYKNRRKLKRILYIPRSTVSRNGEGKTREKRKKKRILMT